MNTTTNTFDNFPEWVIEKWQEIADLLAEFISVPAALVMKAENEFMEVFRSSQSVDNPYHVGDKEKWHGLYCETVIKTQKKISISDASKDKIWDKNPDLNLGMIAYLGFPINFPDSQPFGTLCILDHKERHFTLREENLLLQFKNVIELDLALIQTYDINTNELAKTIKEQQSQLLVKNSELQNAKEKAEEGEKQLQLKYQELTTSQTEIRLAHEELKATTDALFESNTELEIALKKTEASEMSFKLMVTNSPDVTIIQDINGIATFVSTHVRDMFGYEPDTFIGKQTPVEYIFPEDIETCINAFKALQQGKEVVNVEYRFIKASGELIWLHHTAIPIIFENKISGIQNNIRNITERKLAEKAILESKELFTSVFRNVPVPITITRLRDKKFYDVNRAFFDVFAGYTKEEVIGGSPIDLNLWIYPEERRRMIRELQENGRCDYFETKFRGKTGELRDVFVMLELMDLSGEKYVLGITQDITERKQVEKKVMRSEQLYRTLFDQANEGLILLTMDGKIAELNQSFAKMHGYTVDEMKNMDIHALDVLRENAFHGRAVVMQRIFAGEVVRFEVEHYHKNGHSFLLSDTVSLITIAEQQYFLAFHQDITERKQAEEKIREKDNQFRKLSANLPDLIFQFTRKPDGSYFVPVASEGIKNIFGCSPEDVLEDFAPIRRVIYPDDADKFISDIEYSAEHLTHFASEFRVHIPGKPIQWIFSSSTPEKLADGSVTWYGFNADITERKMSEQKVIESREELKKFATHLLTIREEERIMLAREIHDDLGQILVALQIDLGLLKKNVIETIPLIESTDIQLKFDNIVALLKNSIKSARSIMNGLRPELLELHGLVGAVKEYLREFEERYSIRCEFNDGNFDVKMSQQHSLALFRILQEAMNNTVKHAKATLVRIQLQRSDNKVFMQITDNGVGFDINNSGRNDSYGIIGMKERVILLEGELDISSKIGHGTTIRVEILC